MREIQGPAMSAGADTAFDLIEVVRILWKAKIWIFGVTLLGLAVAGYVAVILPRFYVAQGEVVVRAEASVAPDADRAFNATAVNEAVVSTERSVLAAEGLLTRVSRQVEFPPGVLEPGLLSRWLEQLRVFLRVPEAPNDARVEQDALRLAFLRGAVGTGVERGSSVIAVVATTTDPAFSASLVNHMLDTYMRDRVAAQKAVAQNVEVALQERLRQTSEQIRDVQASIAAAMQSPGLIEGTEIPGTQRDLALVGSQLTQARRDAAEKQAAYDAAVQLRNQGAGSPARLAELLDNGSSSASELRRQYALKDQELAGLSARYGVDYPPRMTAQNEVDALARRLTGEAARVVAQRKAELDAANQLVASLSAKFGTARSATSRDSSALLSLSRDRDSLANLQRIAGTIEDRLIAIASQPVDPNARILTQAAVPLVPSYPNKPLIGVLGFVAGLVGSSALVLLKAFLRRLRLSVPRQAAMLGAPLLGCVPRLGHQARPSAAAGLLDTLGLARRGVSDRARIAFEGAALEVEATLLRRQLHVVAITSALPQEGKSTVAVALSFDLARHGRRVLLVNCDLHAGRSNYFPRTAVARPDGGPLLVKAAENLDVLDLRTTASPVSFLQSDTFRGMLATARREYDIVLCDTPPVLSVPDGLVVIRQADAALLVSEFRRKARVADIAELSRRLDATGKPVCGVVMTKVDEKDAGFATYLGYVPARGGRLPVAYAR